jgi:hypothetical protein
LRLEGKSQVGIVPTRVSSDGHMMPCCTIVHNYLHLLVLLAGKQAPCVYCWIAARIICPAVLCLLKIILLIVAWLHPDSMG